MVGLNARQRARFDRAIATLNAIRDEVEIKRGNKDMNVNYYLDGSGTLHLMVAPIDEDITQHDIAHEGHLENAGGGDW